MNPSIPNPVFIFGIAFVVVLVVLRLLRNRSLREKYAALWVVVGVSMLILVAFPALLQWAASILGFAVASNLLFLLGALFLLGVTLHLSLEISRLEDETRVLAEEAAMGRLAIESLEARLRAVERVGQDERP